MKSVSEFSRDLYLNITQYRSKVWKLLQVANKSLTLTKAAFI